MTTPTDPGGALLSAAQVLRIRKRRCVAGYSELADGITRLSAQDARWRALVGGLVAQLGREQAYADHLGTCPVCAPPPVGQGGVCAACWPLFSNLGLERQQVLAQADAALRGGEAE